MCKYHHTKYVTQYILIKPLYIFICLFYSVHPKVDRNEWLNDLQDHVFVRLHPLPAPSFYFTLTRFSVSLCSPIPSIHPSTHGRLIAVNLTQGFRIGPCSSGLLNIPHGEGELALSGKLDMSSLPDTVYWWSQMRKRGKRPRTAIYGC